MRQLHSTQIGTLKHSCLITAGHAAMASNREHPGDMTFQIRAIPASLTARLEDWGDNQQLAEMINNIDAEDHITDLRARVRNLTLTAVHQDDLQQSTTTAILAAVLPVLILSLIAAGAMTSWKFCGPSISARAREWTENRNRQWQPYNLYVKRRQWRDPPPTPELMEEASSNHSFDLPPPEAPERREQAEGNKDTVLEQAGTVSPPTVKKMPTGLPSAHPSQPSVAATG